MARYIYSNDKGEILKYNGHGLNLYYFKECDYDALIGLYETGGKMQLSRADVRRYEGGKELLAELDKEEEDE